MSLRNTTYALPAAPKADPKVAQAMRAHSASAQRNTRRYLNQPRQVPCHLLTLPLTECVDFGLNNGR